MRTRQAFGPSSSARLKGTSRSCRPGGGTNVPPRRAWSRKALPCLALSPTILPSMSRSSFARVLVLFTAFLLGALSPLRARAADPLDLKAVPDPLKPWTAWALDGKGEARCPTFNAKGDLSRCIWPARLQLDLDEHGGHFAQAWHADAKEWAPLPGDAKRWPSAVNVDGKRAIVIDQSGAPYVQLSAGEHAVTGSFIWDSLPESLHVPPETGLLTLRLRGAAIASPERDTQGTVWLQKAATNEEGDKLEFVVHRKVTDDIPLLLATRIELHVAGKNREELVGKVLPGGFIPLSLESPLPARLEPDGHLRVQVRPGVFVLTLTARSEGTVRTLTRPGTRRPLARRRRGVGVRGQERLPRRDRGRCALHRSAADNLARRLEAPPRVPHEDRRGAEPRRNAPR